MEEPQRGRERSKGVDAKEAEVVLPLVHDRNKGAARAVSPDDSASARAGQNAGGPMEEPQRGAEKGLAAQSGGRRASLRFRVRRPRRRPRAPASRAPADGGALSHGFEPAELRAEQEEYSRSCRGDGGR